MTTRKRDEQRQVRKACNRLGLLLLVMVASAFAASTIAMVVLMLTGHWDLAGENMGLSEVMYQFYNGFVYLFYLAVPGVLYFVVARKPLDAQVSFGKAKPSTFFLTLFLGVGVCLMANYPANWAVNLIDAMGLQGAIPTPPAPTEPFAQALYVLSIAVLPALVEELIFRGAVLGGLRKYGDGFAVVASAFLFAVFHGNLPQAIFAFICGLVMGFAVVRTGSIWAGVAIHAVNNAYAAIATLMTDPVTGEFVSNAANIAFSVFLYGMMAIAVILLVVLLIKKRDFFRLGKPEGLSIGGGAKFGALMSNPCVLIFLGYCVFSAASVMLGWLG